MSASKQKPQLDKKKFTVLPGSPLLPTVRLLNLKQARDGHQMVFGSPPKNNPSNKTIMVVGGTGSGKTTLINGMINYVLGVEWEDSWRYKLIHEQTNTNQACSQTSEVTAYQIHHTDGFQVPFSLTIIDTPGFGDTRGIKQDKKITEQIASFFLAKDGIDSIDAVCLVVQCASGRLTKKETYIFNAILSIFGKNIADNIFLLVTFADNKLPPVVEAIKEAKIPCASNPDGSPIYFKFSNSVLFCENSDKTVFGSLFWRMGKTNMENFFTHFNDKLEVQSLIQTKEVLKERRQLEATVKRVRPLIREGLSKLEEINPKRATLPIHETHVTENEDFGFEEKVGKSHSGTFSISCPNCKHTLDFHCRASKDGDKIRTSAMSDGKCTVSTRKLYDDSAMNYQSETKGDKSEKTHQELKSKYHEKALGEKMNREKNITQLEVEYKQVQGVQGKVVEVMDDLTNSLQRLREIALRPDPLSAPNYIDILIEEEIQEAIPGYQKCIKELNQIRDRAVSPAGRQMASM